MVATLVLFCLTIAFFIANVVLFLARGWEDSFVPACYATIYYPKERPVIRRWRETSNGIEAVLSWDAPRSGWRILQAGHPYAENPGPNPMFPTPTDDTDMHGYTALPLPDETPVLAFRLRFLPRSFHEARGLSRPDNYLVYTDTPNARFRQYPVNHWVDTYDYMETQELAEADRIVAGKIRFDDSDSELRRLEKVTEFLSAELDGSTRGTPPEDFRWKSPMQIYRDIRSGAGMGWCTQRAQLFVFFANRAGLRTRLVQGARTQGNTFVFSGHTWVEAWIASQHRWAWVDPSPGIAYATDACGRVLNTVELSRLRAHRAWHGVTMRVVKDHQWPELEGKIGQTVNASFEEVGGVIDRQFVESAIFKWRRPPNVEDVRSDYSMLLKNRTFFVENFTRYFFRPPLAYANFPTTGRRTYRLRRLLFAGFLLSLVALIVVT